MKNVKNQLFAFMDHNMHFFLLNYFLWKKTANNVMKRRRVFIK